MRSLITGILVRRRAVAAIVAGVVCGAALPPVAAPVAATGPAPSPGGAVAWGLNHDGQLGDGTVAPQHLPVPVQGMSGGVLRLAAGDRHSLAVRADGTAWSWGLNGHGQLGDGTTTPRLTPVQVKGLTAVVQIAAGSAHSAALRGDGTVWTWGGNFSGQLGTGAAPADHSTEPERVAGLDGIVQIVARQNHTLARRSDGTVWGWGENTFGELGDGNTGGIRPFPVKVVEAPPFVQVATGPFHSMGLTADGFAFAWGRNGGRLGNGETKPDRPKPVHVPGLSQVRQLAAGSAHGAALMADGTVRTWGSNQSGQLGDPQVGTSAVRAEPGPVPDLTGVTHLAAGHFHNLALRSGELWGWGDAGLWPTPLSTPTANGVLVKAAPIPHVKDAVSVAAGVRTSLVVVTAPPDFTVTLDPPAATVQPGQSAMTRIANIPVNGFSQPPAHLGVSGLPPGVTATLSANTVASGATATLTLNASPLTPPGTHSVTVAANARTVSFALAVSKVGCSITNDADTVIPDNGPAVVSEMPVAGCHMLLPPSTAKVEVHIGHSHRGDLVVDLIEPDGTVHRLHDADPADSGADVHETYNVDLQGLAAVAVANKWRLRVRDIAPGHIGMIDSWTLTLA